MVAILLEKDSKGKTRLPALHVAAKKNDVHSATLLLNNSDVNVDHASAVSSELPVTSTMCMFTFLFVV